MEGPQSSLVPTDYDLRIASIHGEDGSGGEYWLTLPPDVVPTTKTLITIGPKEKPLLKYNLSVLAAGRGATCCHTAGGPVADTTRI